MNSTIEPTQKTNKQLFDAGHVFQVPELKGWDLKLMEDRYGRDYIAMFDRGKWNSLAVIDVATETHVMLHTPGSDPIAVSFTTMKFSGHETDKGITICN